jgi:hypothetical protein
VAKTSFERLKADLDEAFESLRQFTLGGRGATQRDGVAAIERVSAICERLKQVHASGPKAKEVAMAATAAKGKIDAARARLSVLRSKN